MSTILGGTATVRSIKLLKNILVILNEVKDLYLMRS